MAQSVFYVTGFEIGDASEINSLGGGSSVQTGTVRTGGYALKQADTLSTLYASGSATQFAIRMYFRFPVLPAASSSVTFFQLVSGGAGLYSALLNDTGTIGISVDSVNVSGSTVLAINTWYRVELIYDQAAGGVLQTLINGVLNINTTHANSQTAIDSAQVAGDATPQEYFFDDIRIDIGGVTAVGAGQGVARQGIAGTPTYDAGTKVGAATAALCWSQTPVDTTKRVTVVGASPQAQTMLVGKFSTAGSGTEGAQTIASSDTINACKTMFIAKTALASNGAIRRRIGGVDTDTIKALTTSDAYYDDGIWTTTTANLDTAEAGTVSQTANVDTIEDVWVYVDYTPVAGTPTWFQPIYPDAPGSLWYRDAVAY